jgi:ribulose 1,5-bisphosphate synthetase/thiazole synthase
MIKHSWRGSLAACLLFAWTTTVVAADAVNESEREIPVAYQVDVVVVGGGTGAVSAAVAAAQEGSRVFLAAPHPYLGDDMTATLRLWLDEGETPTTGLARRVFDDPVEPLLDPNRLQFRYEADVPSSAMHKDTTPPSRLTDGRWASASAESVQYDSDATITADLGEKQEIRTVRIRAFRRPLGTSVGTGFDVQQATVSISDDGQQWQQIAVVSDVTATQDRTELTVPVDATTRYVRLFVEKPEGFERMLLGEIEIIGPEQEQPEPQFASAGPPPRPMHIKKTLDDVLLENDIQYLYCCYVTDVLRDQAGKPCGIVMANRAGRQAVVAKTIIDATPRATVARLAGAEFRPFEAGTHTFQRVVIGGQPRGPDYIQAEIVAPPFEGDYPNSAKTASGKFDIIRYTMPLHLDDDSYAAYMRVYQQARTLTYDPEQQFTSDVMFEVPSDPMLGRESASGDWSGVQALPLGAFQPRDVDRLYVLGGCADVSRPQAERLLRPVAYMELGQRLGVAAASEGKTLTDPSGARLPGQPTSAPAAGGDVREFLSGVRPGQQLPTVPQDARALPVLGKYDVVVVGGGTGGAPAGIGAARRGAKTLVIEYLHGLGGVGTQGAIASYYWGHRAGFTATIQEGQTRWVVEQKMEWFRQELLKAGADIWFGVVGCGAYVQGDRVVGAVVTTPYGRGVVLANTVIDATGNSDVAASAGAECDYTDATEFGMQGTGLPGRKLGGTYNNTDFTIVDETDMVDIWHVFVYAKGKYDQAFDHGRLIDTRERRRIVGDFTISMTDQVNERTYPDSVVYCWSNFDTHGYTVDPYFLLEHPEKKGIGVYIPYRAMLPKGLKGILVTGLSISSHRDAVPLIRMQPDIQNGGYAAGVAAAMAAEAGVGIRDIDLKPLQRHLVEIGNLPENVLTDEDSYPLPDERIAEAVQTLKEGRGASIIMTAPDRALPLLQQAYRSAASDADRLVYARALAVLGDDSGLDVLVSAIRSHAGWDEGWNYRGMGQFGAALSELDVLLVSLGHTGSVKALPVVLERLQTLNAQQAFSHHRAVGRALELIGDPAAAEPLAGLLQQEGMRGHAHTSIDKAAEAGIPGGTNAEQTRRESLRELLLARALYRCGDFEGLGKTILQEYTQDLRGHLARHAQAILDE